MTREKKFKQRVRERMQNTGESYTTARAALERSARSPGHAALSRHRDPSVREAFDVLVEAPDEVLVREPGGAGYGR